MKSAIISVLRFYQRWISPLTAPRCRFQPTCSSYFLQAVEDHGALTGCRLGLRRLLKCHPFHAGGFDPCPPATTDDAVVEGQGKRLDKYVQNDWQGE